MSLDMNLCNLGRGDIVVKVSELRALHRGCPMGSEGVGGRAGGANAEKAEMAEPLRESSPGPAVAHDPPQ